MAEDTPVSATTLPAFGGPNVPEVFLGDIDRREKDTKPNYVLKSLDRIMQPWFAFKGRLETTANVKFGGHYHYVYQHANPVLQDPDYSSAGLLRVTGNWTPFGRDNPDSGRLAVTVDHRHKIGNGVTPTQLSQQIGFVGQTSVILSDSKWDLVHLYWAQPFRDGKTGFVVGRIDPNDYFYTHGFANPWTGFQNNELQQNTSIALPASSWGGLVGHYFTDNIYGVAGAFDANGNASDDVTPFVDGPEFWKAAEIGWVPSQAERFEKKISLTVWHVDARDEANIDDGAGVVLSASWTFGDYNPFVRLGWSDGDAPRYNAAIMGGFTKKMRNGADLFGIGVNLGQSSIGLGSQLTVESFYNYYLSKNLMITPNAQYIHNPLLNPKDNDIAIFGVRSRFTF
ncbi:carbohydrate porin [Roseibium sp.]|uniref:carbohydrate porin n=1 Tax=Roseibium sp. TaxID=1936156 RepID=UPI003D0A83AC